MAACYRQPGTAQLSLLCLVGGLYWGTLQAGAQSVWQYIALQYAGWDSQTSFPAFGG